APAALSASTRSAAGCSATTIIGPCRDMRTLRRRLTRAAYRRAVNGSSTSVASGGPGLVWRAKCPDEQRGCAAACECGGQALPVLAMPREPLAGQGIGQRRERGLGVRGLDQGFGIPQAQSIATDAGDAHGRAGDDQRSIVRHALEAACAAGIDEAILIELQLR